MLFLIIAFFVANEEGWNLFNTLPVSELSLHSVVKVIRNYTGARKVLLLIDELTKW